MAQYTTTTFERLFPEQELAPELTTEYRSELGETLAYVDYTADGTRAAVTVFNPYKGGERRYTVRDAARAEAIAVKHCTNY